MKTRITELFGIKYPILMGGLQWLAKAELVAAVANAGGLAFISAASFPTVEELEQEIARTRALTDKPFGVNVSMVPDTTSGDMTMDVVKAIARNKVPAVETSGRNPAQYMPVFKEAGIKVIHKVAGVKYAKTVEREGVDAVTVVGYEGAGHPGQDNITTMINVPSTVKGVSIPVVAAGGIHDGNSLVAALSLGAEGVLMGTRFIATKDAGIHTNAQEWIKSANVTDTMMIQYSIKNAVRNIKNRNSYTVLGLEQSGVGLQGLMPFITGKRGRLAWETGDMENTPVSLGQDVGLIDDFPTITELLSSMVKEAGEAVKRLNRMCEL